MSCEMENVSLLFVFAELELKSRAFYMLGTDNIFLIIYFLRV